MPTTTTGIATSFIDFTRASNATVTDSDGKVKWAPHNLLAGSESFDGSNWSKTSATVTANNAAAPNGTTTADKVVFSAQYANVKSVASVLDAGVTYTFGMWVWVATGTRTFSIRDNVSTEFTTITATTTPTLYTVSFTAPAASSLMILQDRATSGFVDTYIWGAHLYRSDLGGMQPNTSAYPMYNPTTPKNLLGYTEDFGNAAWGGVNLLAFGSGSTLNAAGAPNGINTADKIVESTAAGIHSIAQTVTTTASVRTFSVYLKRAERSFAMLYHGVSNAGIAINLDTGATNTPAGIAAPVSSSATPVGDGWYRCSISVNATAAANAFGVYLMPSSSSYSYTGDGTSGIYLWGAQLSDSASLDPYVPVYGAAVTSAAYYGPRRDFDPVTLACKGLLVEEQRANVMTNSDVFTDYTYASPTSTITANTVASPAGTTTADTISFTGAGNDYAYKILTASAGSVFSVWLRTDSGTRTVALRVWTSGQVQLATVTTTWQRFSGYFSSAIDYIGFDNRAAYGASGTAGVIYAWGAQVEAGSFATSYIPTGAATATRNADVASVSTQAFPYSATEGTLVVSATTFSTVATSGRYAGLTLGAARLVDLYAASTQYANYKTTDNQQTAFGTWQQSSKIGAVYKADDYAFVANGTTVVTDTSTSGLETINTLSIGNFNSSTQLNGHIRQITYLPRRISNADLTARTA